jgi:hypothetical protein
MNFSLVTALFLAKPPIYLTTWICAPMQLAAETAHVRRLCGVHLKPGGREAQMAWHASSNHAEKVVAACRSDEFS